MAEFAKVDVVAEDREDIRIGLSDHQWALASAGCIVMAKKLRKHGDAALAAEYDAVAMEIAKQMALACGAKVGTGT